MNAGMIRTCAPAACVGKEKSSSSSSRWNNGAIFFKVSTFPKEGKVQPEMRME